LESIFKNRYPEFEVEQQSPGKPALQERELTLSGQIRELSVRNSKVSKPGRTHDRNELMASARALHRRLEGDLR
jgi:hypothetical protein